MTMDRGGRAVRTSDFRSDTVTRPDAAMRQAMSDAEVGDDVFGDDPTVKKLESETARVLGLEASLFLPTGTMANQVAVRSHCRAGDELLLHEGCHIYRFEQGGVAALHGVQAVPLPGPSGQVPIAAFEKEVRGDDPHLPRTKLLVLENTHNLSGGRVLPLAYMKEVVGFARRKGLALHLDGARLVNAAVALGEPIDRLTVGFDSVSLCLSKGLAAPAGTMLAGSTPLMTTARRVRKLLGGTMRQVGILAAAGLLALSEGPRLLPHDHRRAKRLAELLGRAPGTSVAQPETNIVVAELAGAETAPLLAGLAKEGVLAVAFGPGRVRFVTHRDVDDSDVERAGVAWARALGELGLGASR